MINTTCWPDITCWHKWWAWRPLFFYKASNGRVCRTTVWREYVERRYVYYYGDGGWEYRMLGEQSDQT